MESTKNRILEEALLLFSTMGYEAVSVAQIAEAVGIKAPSLYKHFSRKQDIFEAIIQSMAERYNEQMKNLLVNGSDPDVDAQVYKSVDIERLIQMGKSVFLFYLHDDLCAQFRKLLAIEQYHDSKLAQLYIEQYFDAPISYQSSIFATFMKDGIMKKMDSQIAALHFYAPLYMLLMRCDVETEKESEVLDLLEQHVRQFSKLYMIKGN